MARQIGIIQLSGSIGNINFYATGDGAFARRRTSIDKQRIATDPQFERTRENSSEFAGASSAAGLFRRAFAGAARGLTDKRYSQRVTQLMLAAKELDPVGERGKRRVAQGFAEPAGLSLLEDFDFNHRLPLRGVLVKRPQLSDPAGSISLLQFLPADDLIPPPASTHAELIAYRADFDFAGHVSKVVQSAATIVPLDAAVQDVSLALNGEGLAAGVRVIVLRMRFLQELNGEVYVLRSGAMGVVGVRGT